MNSHPTTAAAALRNMQDRLRQQPVLRAALWAVLTTVLVLAIDAVRGETITVPLVLIKSASFAVGGVFFFFAMRWWERKNAR